MLQFGSVFREHFPSMIAMPLPVRPHMPCFDEWQEGGTLCRDLQPMMGLADPPPPSSNNGALMGADKLRHDIKGGMPFGEELGIIISSSDDRGDDSSYWDALIPQVIWRGTDFNYLHTMYHEMRSPEYRLDIAPRVSEIPGGGFANEYEKRRWAIQKLWEMGDGLLLPRWRGVLLTSEAELEAAAMEMEMQQRGRNGGGVGGGGRDDAILPWANIKFATANVNGIKTPASQCEEYLKLQELGISAIGEYVSMVEQARYKYHIDLGGGGGYDVDGHHRKIGHAGTALPSRHADEGLVPRSARAVGALRPRGCGPERLAAEVRVGREPSRRGEADRRERHALRPVDGQRGWFRSTLRGIPRDSVTGRDNRVQAHAADGSAGPPARW